MRGLTDGGRFSGLGTTCVLNRLGNSYSVARRSVLEECERVVVSILQPKQIVEQPQSRTSQASFHVK